MYIHKIINKYLWFYVYTYNITSFKVLIIVFYAFFRSKINKKITFFKSFLGVPPNY